MLNEKINKNQNYPMRGMAVLVNFKLSLSQKKKQKSLIRGMSVNLGNLLFKNYSRI